MSDEASMNEIYELKMKHYSAMDVACVNVLRLKVVNADLLEELEQQADGCSVIISMLNRWKGPVAQIIIDMLSVQENAARAAIAKARGE